METPKRQDPEELKEMQNNPEAIDRLAQDSPEVGEAVMGRDGGWDWALLRDAGLLGEFGPGLFPFLWPSP